MKKLNILDLSEKLKNKRYLIIGDIHGCLTEFQELLQQVNFNKEDDCLISVGDMLDRGEHSASVLKYCFDLPNFYFCIGNHELRYINYFDYGVKDEGFGFCDTLISWSWETDMPGFVYMAKLMRLRCAPMIKVPNGYVVHAGINPSKMMEEQTLSDCVFTHYFGGVDFYDNVKGEFWWKFVFPDFKIFLGMKLIKL
jgi:hypothetical protein